MSTDNLEVMAVPDAPLAAVPPANPGALMRVASDVAGVCREIVLRTACSIQGRKYVKCEGWMAIATAHGCIASSRDVKVVDGGWTAVGEIRRMSDGVLLSQAEGFVGKDEKKWGNCPEYASRAMAQTRAISRACRAAFAHVVVLIDADLSTTPAEEVPDGGFAPERTTRGVTAGTLNKAAAQVQKMREVVDEEHAQVGICPKCRAVKVRPDAENPGKTVCVNCGHRWDETGRPWEKYEWESVYCPVKAKGEEPKTLGQLMRTDNRRAFGFIMNYVAKSWVGRDGKTRMPAEQDRRFEAACKAARPHFEKKGQGREAEPEVTEEVDDIPF